MNIGINLLFLKQGLAGGTETYSISLLKAMAAKPENTMNYYIFCSSELTLDCLNNHPKFTIIRFKRVSRSLAYRFFFEQIIFPFHLKKYKLHVLHSHGYVGPLLVKNHIVTIHDTNAFAHTHAMPLLKKVLLRFFLKAISKQCSRIITVSEFSKQEIIKNLKAPETKISVVYEACKYGLSIKQVILPTEYQHLLNCGYFMGIGSLSSHKNIQTLLAAFKILGRTNTSIKLVLAGHLPSDTSSFSLFNDDEFKDRIIITGFITDTVLEALLQNAICFVFPSLYEGFGLPLLEAQNAGTVVIASNRGSLPEIGGSSAIYFPALDAVALASEMEQILHDERKRAKYVMLGRENVNRFSWGKAAKETIKIYETQKNG
jgi:glycosyltransferase involved in cell wall biosynthesis